MTGSLEVYADSLALLQVSADGAIAKFHFQSARLTATGEIETVPAVTLCLPTRAAVDMVAGIEKALRQKPPTAARN